MSTNDETVNYEKELIDFKDKTFLLLEHLNIVIGNLEQEAEQYNQIRSENEKLKKEINEIQNKLVFLTKENEKLNNLKLVRLTRNYWKMRKKIRNGVKRK